MGYEASRTLLGKIADMVSVGTAKGWPSTHRLPALDLVFTVAFVLALILTLLGASGTAWAATRWGATTGSDDGNDCSKEASPCRSIRKGIGSMAGGDTLVIGDGTYTESIEGMPSGTEAAYTTIRAANDWGVLIDGSDFPDTFQFGIGVESKHHVAIRGIRVKMSQTAENNAPIVVVSSDHVKIQRCAGSHAPTSGNAATFGIGPQSAYVLVEESYAFGGGRYQFLVYQSEHVVVRRSVARNDHWTGTLQCAGFVNYDSLNTAWQNNIALDSDTANCSGRLYGGFWNENKTDYAPDTSQELTGNIVLNVNAFYSGNLDWGISGTRKITDMIIWGSSGGYHADQGPGDTARITATRMTLGALSGTYNGANGNAGSGTGFSVYGQVENTLTSSLLVDCKSVGVADHTSSDFNVFSGNGTNYGGQRRATPGPNDRSTENNSAIDAYASGLRYLPRIEDGSPLKTAGKDGGQVGAQVMAKVGVDGTLHGEPGWDTVTTEPLWPFPNEDRIALDMGSYDGPGAPGKRGFATGTSLDGSPQTLTKYVWEYLGNAIPFEVYGLHIASPSLPQGRVGAPYDARVSVGGGTAPYTWTLDGGTSLPPGLVLDGASGAITGTPTAAGTTTVTIAVRDSASPQGTATKSFSLEILTADGSAAPSTSAEPDDGGCGCRAAPLRTRAVPIGLALVAGVLLSARVRRRGAADWR